MSWDEDRRKKQEEEAAAKKASEEQTKAQADDLISKMRLSFEEVVKPIREKVESFDQRFMTLEEATKKPAKDESKTTETPSVFENEDVAFNTRQGPLAAAIVTTNARITENTVLAEVERNGWAEFIPQIREQLERNTPIQTKAAADYSNYVQNVADMIIGREARKAGVKRDATRQSFFIEPAGSTGKTTIDSNRSRLMEEATDGKVDVLKKSGGDLDKWMEKMGFITPEQKEAFLKSEA
jgi:hypothetical protein